MAPITATVPLSLTLYVSLTHPESSTKDISQTSKDTPSSLSISSTLSPAQSSSFTTSSSLITVLQPFCPTLHSTNPLHTAPSFHPCPSTILTPTNLLSTLLCPVKWDQFFVILSTAPNLTIPSSSNNASKTNKQFPSPAVLIVHALPQLYLSPKPIQFPVLTALVNLFLHNATTTSMLVMELFPAPQLIAYLQQGL